MYAGFIDLENRYNSVRRNKIIRSSMSKKGKRRAKDRSDSASLREGGDGKVMSE